MFLPEGLRCVHHFWLKGVGGPGALTGVLVTYIVTRLGAVLLWEWGRVAVARGTRCGAKAESLSQGQWRGRGWRP